MQKIRQCYLDLLNLKLSILDQMFENDEVFKDDQATLKVVNDLLVTTLNKVNSMFESFELCIALMESVGVK